MEIANNKEKQGNHFFLQPTMQNSQPSAFNGFSIAAWIILRFYNAPRHWLQKMDFWKLKDDMVFKGRQTAAYIGLSILEWKVQASSTANSYIGNNEKPFELLYQKWARYLRMISACTEDRMQNHSNCVIANG